MHASLQGDTKNALFKASWEEIQALEDEIGIMKQVGEGSKERCSAEVYSRGVSSLHL